MVEMEGWERPLRAAISCHIMQNKKGKGEGLPGVAVSCQRISENVGEKTR
jgi:hypothetical protein